MDKGERGKGSATAHAGNWNQTTDYCRNYHWWLGGILFLRQRILYLPLVIVPRCRLYVLSDEWMLQAAKWHQSWRRHQRSINIDVMPVCRASSQRRSYRVDAVLTCVHTASGHALQIDQQCAATCLTTEKRMGVGERKIVYVQKFVYDVRDCFILLSNMWSSQLTFKSIDEICGRPTSADEIHPIRGDVLKRHSPKSAFFNKLFLDVSRFLQDRNSNSNSSNRVTCVVVVNCFLAYAYTCICICIFSIHQHALTQVYNTRQRAVARRRRALALAALRCRIRCERGFNGAQRVAQRSAVASFLQTG